MTIRGVIEIATGDLLRFGELDWTATDPDFNPATEVERTDVPLPAFVRDDLTLASYHRWNGAAWVLVTQTPGGAGDENVSLEQAFTFSDSSPIDFAGLNAGDKIIDVEVEITTTFDDAAATVDLGLTSAPGGLLSTADIYADTLGTFSGGENVDVASADTVRIRLTPGASTQGAGVAIVVLRR